MKRWLPLLVLLSAVTGTVIEETSRGQVPPGTPQNPFPFDGPGEQGATLKRSAPGPNEGVPSSLQQNWNLLVAPNWNPNLRTGRIALPPSNRTDINRDIEVTPQAGAWLILVQTYSGEKAPYQAREFAALLYNDYKKYNLRPCIFNYGAEEKRKEFERAEAERTRQREAMRREGLTPDLPIRVHVARIDEQTGVLIGGYRTQEEALLDLKNRIRKLPAPDPKKVALAVQYVGVGRADETSKYPCATIQVEKEHNAYVNPFATAFPVRNPSIPAGQSETTSQEDLVFLRKVNKHEPFSALNCKKPYTLAVKQFKIAVMMNEGSRGAKAFEDRFLKTIGEWDFAAQNAHNLADGFRKLGLKDTYVLHARYCSFVTVGGYDSPEDPDLLQRQNQLEQHFRQESLRPLELFPRPIVMEVPH